jgi:Zn-dependent protease/predicted transcriptional regulator
MRHRDQSQASTGWSVRSGFRLGRVAGIDLHVDWSLLIIFWLIASSLALSVFPVWHPGWSRVQAAGTAIAAALLFFSSVLAHELSHALIGRRFGIPVRRITLFIFGGVAELAGEPHSWRAELAMAVAGPLTSIVLGAVFLFLAMSMAGPPPVELQQLEPWLAGLGALPTLMLWLGQVNIVLALFNLVPGFPLDGGRVLRAALWGMTGNLRGATQWASMGGRVVAWVLMGMGIAMFLGADVPLFGSGPAAGLWLILIGWFLDNAALTSYRQLLLQETLQAVPVRRLMRTDFLTVSPDLSVAEFVNDHLLPSGQRAFPVQQDGRLSGIVSLQDAQKIDRAQWSGTAVAQVMTRAEQLVTVSPEDDAFVALLAMGRGSVNQLLVLENGKTCGLLRREDLVNWLALYGERSLQSGRLQ